MKKNILKLIAVASVSTFLIGCGGSGGDDDGGTPINPTIVDESIDSIAFTQLRDVSGDQGYKLSVNIADALDPADNITYYFCEDKFGDATPGQGVPDGAKYNYLATYENSYDYDVGFIQNVYPTAIWFYSQIGSYGQYWITSDNGHFLEGEIYPLADSIENDTGTIEINSISEIDCSTITKDD